MHSGPRSIGWGPSEASGLRPHALSRGPRPLTGRLLLPHRPQPGLLPHPFLPSFIISSLDSARHDRSPGLKRRAGSSDVNTPPTHHDPPGAHRNPRFPRKVSHQGPRGPPGSHPAGRCREVTQGSGTGGSWDPPPQEAERSKAGPPPGRRRTCDSGWHSCDLRDQMLPCPRPASAACFLSGRRPPGEGCNFPTLMRDEASLTGCDEIASGGRHWGVTATASPAGTARWGNRREGTGVPRAEWGEQPACGWQSRPRGRATTGPSGHVLHRAAVSGLGHIRSLL